LGRIRPRRTAEGDTLIVTRPDRLAKSTRDLLDILHAILALTRILRRPASR
jgi:DNA invertase Pin-like site-specific DNA recombinase